MLKLAARNVFRHQSRSALTIAAITLGVASLILSGGFVEDVFVQLREATIHSSFGHLQIYRNGYYEQGRQAPYRYMIDDPDRLAQRLAREPQVDAVGQRINLLGLLNNGRSDLPVIAEGIEPGREAAIGSFIELTAGRNLTDADDYRILLGEGVADALQLAPGDYATLLANTPDGMLNSLEFEVAGIFRSISQQYDARAVRLPLAAARELAGSESVHSLVVSLSETQDTDPVAAQLRALLAEGDYEIKTWYELAAFYQKTVDLYQRQFLVLQIIITVLVLLGVANSVNITVYDRTGEFGTLMALGDRGAEVLRLVLTENVLLGILGSGVGVLVGAALAWLISGIGIPMPPPPNMNIGYTAMIRLVPQGVLSAFAIGFVATALAAIMPAWRMSRTPVVEALQQA